MAKEKMDCRFLGIEELAIYLGVKVNTIRSWVWQRKNIPYHKIGRLIKFDRKDVENWAEKRRIEVLN
jgi:excisionase family DNA binding protein